MFKRYSVVMLPTNEKASPFVLTENNYLVITGLQVNTVKYVNQHIYIISDDDIKEGDWCLNISKHIIYKKDNLPMDIMWKKIIATTDISLTIKSEQAGDNAWYNPLPKPSDSFICKFIEEYNKGNVITNVMVEYEQYRGYSDELDIHGHNIDILKINTKNNSITIKKIKDSWNREEVIGLINKIVKGRECKQAFMCYSPTIIDVDKWIEDNL